MAYIDKLVQEKEKDMSPDVIIVKCCSCQRIRHEGQWIHEAETNRRQDVYSHGYCPVCLMKAYASIDACEACAG